MVSKVSILRCIFLSSCFLCVSLFPAFSAEIININYKYKLAFCDLTENDVHAGDIVTVKTSQGRLLPLKVLEAYPVMIKVTVPDGDMATEKEFTTITVGNQVTAGAAAVPSVRARTRPEVTAAPPKTVEPVVTPEATPAPAKTPMDEGQGRVRELETRIDQMMASNMKLTETITQLLSDKSAMEEKTRRKETELTDAKEKISTLTASLEAAEDRGRSLAASVEALEKSRASSEKEILDQNLKIVELKKKLAKLVDIVNKNMKAYE